MLGSVRKSGKDRQERRTGRCRGERSQLEALGEGGMGKKNESENGDYVRGRARYFEKKDGIKGFGKKTLGY